MLAESATTDSLAALVQHLPTNAHLLLASRVEPALGLPRLRALGQLVEFGVDDLRFTAAEASMLLKHTTGLELESDSVASLMRRTEGWVTGLRLAGLSLVGRADPRAFVLEFSGSHRFVLDYLLDEVVRRQPPHVQVLSMGTFDRLGAELGAEPARSELRATGETARKRQPTSFEDLTRQKLQVARAVGQEITNRKVAAQLFISPRTVDHNLRSIFQKLGISSGAELLRIVLTT
jgi:ATP/maltotriose-dependent transcriptional regulator MalT